MRIHRCASTGRPLLAFLLAVLAGGVVLAHGSKPQTTTPRSGPGAVGEAPALPPAPPGVVDLDLGDLYRMPIGRWGLEYSERAQSLEGKKVRILGYMARSDHPAPGVIMLAPYPFVLHEDEYGMADDLPATVVHVLVPDRADEPVPFTPGPLLLTGTLELGSKEMADGRRSSVRLVLDPASSRAADHHVTPEH